MIMEASPCTSNVALSGPNRPGSSSKEVARSGISVVPASTRRIPRPSWVRRSSRGSEVGVTRYQSRSVTPGLTTCASAALAEGESVGVRVGSVVESAAAGAVPGSTVGRGSWLGPRVHAWCVPSSSSYERVNSGRSGQTTGGDDRCRGVVAWWGAAGPRSAVTPGSAANCGVCEHVACPFPEWNDLSSFVRGTVRSARGHVERVSPGSVLGEEVAQGRGLATAGGNRLSVEIGKYPAIAPHAGLIAESVTVRSLMVATRAMALGLEEGIDERTHPEPSESQNGS